MTNNKLLSIVLSSLLLTTSLYSEDKEKKVEIEKIWKNNVDKNVNKIDNVLKELDTPLQVKNKSKVAEAEGSWSLVNENCEPEFDIDFGFNDMMEKKLKAFKKALNPDVWKQYMMNNSLDGMVNYFAMYRCNTQLYDSLSSGINQSDMSAKMTECQNKNTKGLVTGEFGTTTGTEFSTNNKSTIDYASLGATATCINTVFGKKKSELYNKCLIEEKRNARTFFNGNVDGIINQANFGLEQQNQKCMIDKQNSEYTFQSIIGNGYKTLSDGDKVSLIRTNAVDENIEDSKKNRIKALNKVNKISNSMMRNRGLTDYSYTDVFAYSLMLKNWSSRVFESGCNEIDIKNDKVDAKVLDCRWDDKQIATLTTDEVIDLSDSSKSKVTILDECREIAKLNPIFVSNPDIVMNENGKDEKNHFVPNSTNRFDYFLKVDKKWNSKTLPFPDGSKFNSLTAKINKIQRLTKLNEISMRTTCRDWAMNYRDSINEQILATSTNQAMNQAVGGENGNGISEITDRLRHTMETKQNHMTRAKIKILDDLIALLNLRLLNISSNNEVKKFRINIEE